jgi:lipopolysaccharide biosynthesis glycosyltransferase
MFKRAFIRVCSFVLSLLVFLGASVRDADLPKAQAANDPVNILITCDNNYGKQAVVCLYSLLLNGDKNRRFEIYIVRPENFDEEVETKIINLEQSFKNCHITFLQLRDDKFCSEYGFDKFSREAYFRLFIGDLFDEEDIGVRVEKCLYLDADIIVRDDISKLYDKNLDDDHWVGACSDPLAFCTCEERETYPEEVFGLQDKDFGCYFNSGVILFNIRALKKNGVSEIVEDYFREGATGHAHDQAAINYACRGHVRLLSSVWNFLLLFPSDVRCKGLEKARRDPKIVHFAGSANKPWSNDRIPFGCFWWRMAIESGAYSEDDKKYTDFYREKNKKNSSLPSLADTSSDSDENKCESQKLLESAPKKEFDVEKEKHETPVLCKRKNNEFGSEDTAPNLSKTANNRDDNPKTSFIDMSIVGLCFLLSIVGFIMLSVRKNKRDVADIYRV